MAGLDIDADLAIVDFSPGSTGFIAQTQVQSQVVGNAPIVLRKARIEPVALMPAARTGAPSDIFRKSKRQIRAGSPPVAVLRLPPFPE